MLNGPSTCLARAFTAKVRKCSNAGPGRRTCDMLAWTFPSSQPRWSAGVQIPAGRPHRGQPTIQAGLDKELGRLELIRSQAHLVAQFEGWSLMPICLVAQCGQCTPGAAPIHHHDLHLAPLQPGTPDPRRDERASDFKRRSTQHFIDGTVCACGERENLGPAFAARDGNIERWLSLPLP